MIPQDLIKKVSELTGIKDTTHLEKDLYLQGIISELSKSNYFRKNYVFKGGTCLTKAYFGYYRFSEDLDFTWINQQIFENMSAKQERKIISKELETLTSVVF
ncbi:MAG: nucleotidyl transferase AbiEii/AbiGii toxin family protein, partial [archaeon]